MATTQHLYNKSSGLLKAMVFSSLEIFVNRSVLVEASGDGGFAIQELHESGVASCSLQSNFLCKEYLLCLIGGSPAPRLHWSDLMWRQTTSAQSV